MDPTATIEAQPETAHHPFEDAGGTANTTVPTADAAALPSSPVDGAPGGSTAPTTATTTLPPAPPAPTPAPAAAPTIPPVEAKAEDVVQRAEDYIRRVEHNFTDEETDVSPELQQQRNKVARLNIALLRLELAKKRMGKTLETEVDILDDLERAARNEQDRKNEPAPLFDDPALRQTSKLAPETTEPDDSWRDRPIEDLKLGNRPFTALKEKSEVKTIGELVDAITEAERLTELPGIGAKAGEEIEDALEKFWIANPKYCKPTPPAAPEAPAPAPEGKAQPIHTPDEIHAPAGAVEAASSPLVTADAGKPIVVRDLININDVPHVVTGVAPGQPSNIYELRPVYESVAEKHSTEGDALFGKAIEHGGKFYEIGPVAEALLVRDGDAIEAEKPKAKKTSKKAAKRKAK